MFELKDVTAGYGVIPAITRVSLVVQKGETVALLGSNGAGKTAVLQTIMGKLRPTEGHVIFEGQDISRWTTRRIVEEGIVMVFCQDRVFPDMTVEENLRIGSCSPRARKVRKELFDRVYELFPRLAERKRQNGSTLSGGEQGMLALGKGLMGNPKILLVDELSLGLAPIMISQLFSKIELLKQQGVSILLAEQNARMALKVCDRAYLLRNGHVILSETSQQIRSDDSLREMYLGA